jgi:hypothetical protein
MTDPVPSGMGKPSRDDVVEFEGSDAGYAWWRNTHPDGYVIALRARHPPLLHRARCSEIDRDRHPGRLGARGSRQLCATSKSALRAWLKQELPDMTGMLARCPTCGP